MYAGGRLIELLLLASIIITFCVSRRRRKMYCGHERASVCLSVCLCVCESVRDSTPTLLHGPAREGQFWGKGAAHCKA